MRSLLPSVPRVAVVLGSGLGAFAEALEDPVSIPFADLPPLPPARVEGHGGRFVAGRLRGVDVLVQAGRVHAYEGVPEPVVAAPVRLMAALGVEAVIMTNAAGGIHPLFGPGDVVLLDDQINLSFRSVLQGPTRDAEVRFPDMGAPFDAELCDTIRAAALRLGVTLREGTYAGVLGPAYETPAEVGMLRRLGADLVGMSTVHEVAVARAAGLRVAVLSLVTNRAAGLGAGVLSHDEVLEVGRRASADMLRLLTEAVCATAARWPASGDAGSPGAAGSFSDAGSRGQPGASGPSTGAK